MLSGGAGFGKFHYGVIKALYEADLMPKIICGSSVGSLIAAGISVLSHDELELATRFESALRDSIVRWNADSAFETFMQILRKDTPLVCIDTLKHFVRNIVEDLTFKEVYERNGIILNINVSDGRFQH